jgi:hypothetical protein
MGTTPYHQPRAGEVPLCEVSVGLTIFTGFSLGCVAGLPDH